MSLLILVVDDDPDICHLLDRVLTRQGYRVTTALDGAEALAKIAASVPELVITDLMMPRMSGWELIAHLREQLPLLAIVIVSAAAEPPAFGGIPFLAKPFALDTLLAMVRQRLPSTA